ncbi:MAG: glycosyltransferase family 9 protein [Verrucomicrobia bacterium]|nr:MAG: glycosyltransferase family 9 protein [Verrucomicrobiota bacterium]
MQRSSLVFCGLILQFALADRGAMLHGVTTQAQTAGGMLIAAPGRWDEACFAVPAVRALMASGIGVGLLCAAGQREFWETLPGLAVLDFPTTIKPRALAGQLAGQWQAVLLWEPGVAADACIRAKIARRLGPNEPSLKKYLTHPVPLASAQRPLEHRVRHYLTVVETLGLDTTRSELFAPASLGLPRHPQSLLLFPDSDFGVSHEWPLERWTELVPALQAAGWALSLAGLAQGSGLATRLLERLGGTLPYLKFESLATALPVLAAQALVVAADGSLPHLAAFVGTPCVTLFGPNDPAWKRPLGRSHSEVRRHVACAPCFLTKCPLDGRCQGELSVARVLAAVAERSQLRSEWFSDDSVSSFAWLS